jgi:hypothetical protein
VSRIENAEFHPARNECDLVLANDTICGRGRFLLKEPLGMRIQMDCSAGMLQAESSALDILVIYP